MKKIFNRKGVFAKSLSVWSAFAAVATTTAPAFAAGTAVLGGSAELSQLTRVNMDKNDPNAAVFSSTAASGVLDWTKFNIGAGQSMTFNGAKTTFFNLVDGSAGRSQIDGIINGSGNVWVINPAGIAFGAGSTVDVGGLFAAAAGNISNADALRNGTAAMPSFSSFEGTVDASKGSFTADQVALMGKAVTTAGGDFSGAKNLTLAATQGAADVDEIQGGKVKVDIRDFAPDGSEITLGDLKIDGALSIRSTGKIVARQESPESPVKGPKLLATGTIPDPERDGDINISSLDLLAYDIDIDGKLWSKQGHVDVEALRNLNVNAEVEAADYVSLQAGGGVNVNANVTSHGGNIDVSGSTVAISNGKTMKTESGSSKIALSADNGILIGGEVDSAGGIEISTVNGDIDIPVGGCVKTSGDGSVIALRSSTGGMMIDSSYNLVYSDGDIVVNGDVMATGAAGVIEMYAGDGFYSTGDIDIAGTVKADSVFLGTGLECPYNSLVGERYPSDKYGSGSVFVRDGGLVQGGSQVMMGTSSGDVEVSNGGMVKTTGENASLDIFSAFAMLSSGDVRIYGRVESEKNGEVGISSALGMGATGALEIGSGDFSDASVSGKNLMLSAGFDATIYNDPEMIEIVGGLSGYGGKILLEGSVAARGDVSVSATKGVAGNGTIDASEGALSVCGGLGGISLTGKLSAKNALFDSTQYSSYMEDVAYAGSIFAGSTENDIGKLSAKGKGVIVSSCSSLEVGDVSAVDGDVRLSTSDGKLTVKGSVEASKDVRLIATDGDLAVATGADVRSKGKDGTVSLFASETKSVSNISVDGTVAAEGENGSVSVMISPTQTGTGTLEINGTVQATGDKGEVKVYGAKGKTSVAGTVEASCDEGKVTVVGYGDVELSGTVKAKENAAVSAMSDGNLLSISGVVQAEGTASAKHFGNGNVHIGGTISSKTESSVALMGNGSITVDGTVSSEVKSHVAGTMKAGTSGNVVINGNVRGGSEVMVYSGDGETKVNGTVAVSGERGEVYVAAGVREDSVTGNVTVNGTVSADGAGGGAYAISGLSSNASQGDVHFGASGQLRAGDGVYVVANGGGVRQDGASLPVSKNGYVPSRSYNAALKGATVNVKAKGDVGDGKSAFVAVDGKTFVEAGGDVSIAAAAGGDLMGGPGVGSKDTALFGKITFGDPNGTSNIKAGGDLAVYAAGKIEAGGLFQAGGNLAVSAASLGDVSYLRADGNLTINNVGKTAHPQIAYFESVDGREPRINNLPNDMVIFIDGRLAGGNLNILNKFGADEAFMVATPELKSTQGIFGNPPFLHSDLDVANPMEVSAIDYLIQEVPRLTLSSDFPDEVDQNIEASGLSQKDVYWFGQN